MKLHLLIVDDHALFRAGLALLLADASDSLGVLEISQAGSISEAERELASDGQIGLVLLDLALPDSAGTTGLIRLRAEHPSVPVVVLSADDRPETILNAIDQGASGFVPKTSQSDIMRTALSVVISGGVFLPESVLGHRPGALSERRDALAVDQVAVAELGLSPRQAEILRLLVEGKPTKLICRHLGLSEPTVKTHLSVLYRKLNVNSRTQAVVRVAQLQLQLRPMG